MRKRCRLRWIAAPRPSLTARRSARKSPSQSRRPFDCGGTPCQPGRHHGGAGLATVSGCSARWGQCWGRRRCPCTWGSGNAASRHATGPGFSVCARNGNMSEVAAHSPLRAAVSTPRRDSLSERIGSRLPRHPVKPPELPGLFGHTTKQRLRGPPSVWRAARAPALHLRQARDAAQRTPNAPTPRRLRRPPLGATSEP